MESMQISVIVPVYNVEPYIHQCIDSILNQTYHNIEILLIDDGSPDRCGDICDDYVKKDKRVRVFHNIKNKGLSSARNLGILEAKGDYIGFVDPDDWIDHSMYEVLLQRLRDTKTDICACGFWCKNADGQQSERNVQDVVCVGFDAVNAFVHNTFRDCVWNKLYRKECWDGIQFPDGHLYEDVSTVYKVILKRHSVSGVSKQLYYYRERNGSITNTVSMNKIKDYWDAHYVRYQHLCILPEFRKDQNILENLERQIADALVTTWKWTYSLPQRQRDYEFLYILSSFARKKYPLWKKKWDSNLSICLFLTQYASRFSLASLYCFNSLFKVC